MSVSDELIKVLACPACKSEVAQAGGKIVCQNKNCGLRFPVRDGIPVMLTEEAERP